MEKWIMDTLVYNERNHQYKSNDAIFAMILTEQKMQRIAQTAPPTAPAAGPTIEGDDILTRLFRVFKNQYLPAKMQFEMAVKKNPALKQLSARIYEVMRSIDHDYTQLAPHLLMQPGSDMQAATDTLRSDKADVQWHPFAGSEGTGSPVEQANIAREAAQGNARSVLEAINMFTTGVDNILRRNI